MSALAIPARSDAAEPIVPVRFAISRLQAKSLIQRFLFIAFSPLLAGTAQATGLGADSRPTGVNWTGSIMKRGSWSAGISKCLSKTIKPIPKRPG